MPKVKAGALSPKIDAVRKKLEEKKDSLSPGDSRRIKHHLRRLQRKARRIRAQDARVAAAAKPKAAGGDEASA